MILTGSLLLAGAASAQPQAIVGIVVDRAGQPVPDARVTTLDGVTVRTTPEGRFIAPRTSHVEVSADGYQRVRVATPDVPLLRVVLDPAPLTLSDQVVVTAERRETDCFVVPQSVSVVSREELDRRLPRTTPEALMETAGVFVQKTNHGGGSPYVRGLVGNQVLVLVDGIRLNNATYRLGPNQYLATVDPSTIERIEVVRGAGSVLYGTDALGGVVHVVTRKPTPREGGWFLDARSVVKGATGAPEQSARVELEGGWGSMAWLGGVSVKAFGDLRAGGSLGVLAPSGYDQADADLKVHWAPGSGRTLTATVQRTRQEDVGRFDQVAQRGFASWAFDPQERWLGSVTYAQRIASLGIERLSVTTAFQQTREDRRSRRTDSFVDVVERDDVRVFSTSLDVDWRPLAGWRVTSGIDVTSDRVDSSRTDTLVTTGAVTRRRGLYADDAEAGSAAAFVWGQREYGVLHVEGGARHAAYVVRSSAPAFGRFTLRSDALVAQGGLSIGVGPWLRPYASVWQGFRAPNIDDVSALGSFDFGVEAPAPDLTPESSVGIEGGLKWRTDRWSAAGAIYRVGLRDLIERVRGTWLGASSYEGQQVYVRDNVGRGYVRGVELEADLALTPTLRLLGWMTQTFGEQVSREEPLRRIPPVHGLVGVVWTTSDGGAWVDLRWRAAARQDRLATGDLADHRIDPTGTAAWQTVALRAGWRATPSLEIVGGLENAFDQAYRTHGSGIDGAGRSLWLGAQIRLF